MTGEVYLVDALGFFLQLWPCTLLCFVPFGEEKLKVKKRWIYLTLTVWVLAAAAIFPAVTHLPFTGTYLAFNLTANLYMLAAIALTVLAHSVIVRENIMKKLLVVYIIILYAALIYWLSNRFEKLMEPRFADWGGDIRAVYDPTYIMFYPASMATIFPVVFVFMRRSVASFLREIEPERMKREFHYASLSTAAFLALMMAADMTLDIYEGLSNFIVLFLVLNQALLYWMIFTSAVNRSREENALRAVEAQKLQYDRISQDMERAARLRHDMRHHWNYLYSLVEDGDVDKLGEYLSSLAEQTGHLENEVFCEDATLNALLQYYAGRARDDGIEYTVAARCGEMNVRPEDLTVIIGNVMENALRACLKVSGERRIDVAVGLFHGAFTLEVTNSCPGARIAKGFEPDSEGFLPAGAFLSTRNGGGHGMAAVADLAGVYSGTALFKYDPEAGTFTARVILSGV